MCDRRVNCETWSRRRSWFAVACGLLLYIAYPSLSAAHAQSVAPPPLPHDLGGAAHGRASGPEAGSPAQPSSPESQLLSLLEEERILLEDFGPDYYKVQQVRLRIAAVKDFIAAQRAEQARQAAAVPPQVKAPARPPQSSVKSTEPAKGPLESSSEEQSEPVRPKAENPQKAKSQPAKAKPAVAPSTSHEVEKKSPVETRPIQVVVERPPAQASSATLFGIPVLLAVVSILVGLLVGLLVHVFAFLWMLRRLSSRDNPLFRLEVVDRDSAPLRGAQARVLASPAPVNVEARQENKPEGTLLQQLFDDNVNLREQIGQLEAVAG